MNQSSENRQGTIRPADLIRHPVHFLSLGFGSGLAPKAPGTMGTLAAVPLVLLVAQGGPVLFAVATLLVCLIGVYLCGATARALGVHDHPAIVWDEVAGLMVAMLFVPVSWLSLLLAFVIFRVFDILKPWPIRYFDRHVHGGFGIMLDDILAGLCTLVILHALVQNGILL